MLTKLICAILFASHTLVSWAGPNDPIVSAAWIGESIPGQTTVTVQLNLTTVKAVNLLSVTSPAAESIEIHSLMQHKGEMKVRVVPNLMLPDHRTVIFGSKGLFLMMTGLKQPLNIGDKVQINLEVAFSDKQVKTISSFATVRKMDLSYKHYGPNEVYDHR